MRRIAVATAILVPLTLLLVLRLTPVGGTSATVSVLTQHNDNARSGTNLNEATLTTANVNPYQFGKLFSRAVDGQIFAQPLYVPNLTIPGQGSHNVVFVATMHNTVYAFDADDPTASTPLWRVNLGASIPVPDSCFGYAYGAYHDIHVEVGIVSTPVIDAATGTMYVVAGTKDAPSGFGAPCSPAAYVHRLHALDITTGLEKFGGPTVIRASAPGSGPDSSGGIITFSNEQQLQRPGLLLSNGTVYLAFASYADTDPYHGWIMGYDATTLQQKNVFISTPNAETASPPSIVAYGGGIWQAGQGPVADASGNIYVMTGNGTTDTPSGGADYGDSIIKLSPSLAVTDWFTPYNQSNLNSTDLDLGSAGVLLMSGTNNLVAGGKQGVFYVLNTSSLGHYHAGSDSQITQSFQASAGHIHGAPPVYWNGPTGSYIYVWGENDYLKAYRFVSGQFQTTPSSMSSMPAATGMPGGFLSLSANGSTPGTAILWASRPYTGDANVNTVPGILQAFDATDLSKELWDSKMNAARDDVGNFGKFNPPTVANGKVYLGTFSGYLNVYGLLPASQQTPIPTPPTATASATPLAGAWSQADVGAVGTAGSGTYAGGTFTVAGSGADIWTPPDAFHYVYQPLPGDGQIVARVASQTNTDSWAKAGVMIRQGLDPSAPYADVMVDPGGGTSAGNTGTSFQRRPTAGAQSVSSAGPAAAAPYWVKLVRQGGTLSGYVSADGAAWTLVGTDTVPMTGAVYAGLAVTAHNNAALSTATFDGVALGQAAAATATASGPTATASGPTATPAPATPTPTVPAVPTATSPPAATASATPLAASTATTIPATATATSTPSIDLAKGLVGYWPLDEGSGGVTSDASGHGNTGTLSQTTWTTGKFGNALGFNGTSSYVSLGVNGMPAANAPQSISWWMNIAAAPGASQSIIALTNDNNGSGVQPGLNGGSLAVWKSGGSFLVWTSMPTSNAWHHCVYSFDGTTHRLYEDGVLQATSTVTPQASVPTKLEFGRWTGGFEYYQGALDNVRIYTRALSAAEVLALASQP